MLILTTSLLALILLFLPDVPTKFQSTEITFDESEEKFATIFKSLIDRFFSLTLFLSIPAAALFNKWLFKKQSYNYAEHVVIATFIANAVNIFSPFTYFALPLPPLPQKIIGVSFTLIMLIYSARAYVKIFDQKIVVGVLKYMVSTFLTSIFYVLEFLVLGAFYYYIYYG